MTTGLHYRRCPRCGSQNFYLEVGPVLVSFHVTQEGSFTDVQPAGVSFFRDDDTKIHCVSCSWCGLVDELIVAP